MVTILANIREAKAQKDAAQQEYEQDEKRARAQEDAIRQVNQKMADKAMTVNWSYIEITNEISLCVEWTIWKGFWNDWQGQTLHQP